MKMESLQQRREELERKEYQLKESLLKFDKFLKVDLMSSRLFQLFTRKCEQTSYAKRIFLVSITNPRNCKLVCMCVCVCVCVCVCAVCVLCVCVLCVYVLLQLSICSSPGK